MPDHFYVYPAYFDRSIARADGRRVPAADGLADVTVDEIVQAAKRLGWRAEAEPAKQYPRRDFTYAGRAKLSKKADVPKARCLRDLAAEIRKIRTAAGKK
jgi:signal recognition particle subunit SEC65